jgi:DNA polymerase-3 subunit gamma/tau
VAADDSASANDDAVAIQAPYQALYRRYRPQRFADVLGQEHITRALRHAVRDHKVAHAYLFSGPRGTGKTSTARILAMALNCEHPDDGEPDGTCPSCVAIRQGVSLDVQELDSATNRGIDEMRDLLGRVALGTPGQWKVYIIDEVHQMTSAAASALLKTLEDPPGHVIFVLATTDPQKVLPTIRSRTQHFEFHLLGSGVLTSLLRGINDRAALGVPPEAIDLVVRRGHGSARDAISALDQVAAAGTVDDEATILSDIVEALADRDPGRVLLEVAEAISAGRDPRRLGTDLLEQLRDGFLVTQARSLVLLPDDAAAAVESQARRLGTAALVRAMEVLGQALIDMRDAPDPRITLEVALVRLAAAGADDTSSALLVRIERLERLVGDGAEGRGPPPSGVRSIPPPASSPAPPVGSPPPVTAVVSESPLGPSAGGESSVRRSSAGQPAVAGPPPVAPPAVGQSALGAHRRPRGPQSPEGSGQPSSPPTPSSDAPAVQEVPPGSLPTRDELTIAWGDTILAGLRPGVKVYLSSGRFVGVDDAGAIYAVPDRGLLTRAEANRAEVEAALAAHFGRRVPVRLVLDEAGGGLAGAAGAARAAGVAGPTAAAGPVSAPVAAGTAGVAAPPGAAGFTGVSSPAALLPEDPTSIDFDDLIDAPGAVLSPEQRLLEAFPGAEEVPP